MDYGIHYMDFACEGGPHRLAATIADTAQVADEAGAAWFTFMDHYFQMEHEGGPSEPMLEGYTCLGFVAARTRRVQLGLLVTGVTYRHPGLLAKIVSTVDVLSGGRAMLGLGAAWYEREHVGLGVPYPPVAARFEQLEETIHVVRQMWSDENGAFSGRHFRLAETIDVPGTLQQQPPLVIGGVGERKTLRLVAQYADACNMFAFGPDFVRGKLEVLDRHCADLGRDPSTVQRTILGGPDPLADTDVFLREMERYAAIGVGHVQLRPDGTDPVRFVTEFAERVAPHLARIGA